MKRDPSRPPQPKIMPARHRFEHEAPTHIHDPEADMMLLARWANRAMKNRTWFWGTIIGSSLGLLAIVLIIRAFSSGGSKAEEVWAQLETANSAAERAKVADDFPSSPASIWARLEAATEYYNQGFDALPNSRDVALPMLKKAVDNFDQVVKDAPKDSPQARAAALGKARSLEARNELAKAIEQYQLVEKTWPGTPEATQAQRLAEELTKPEVQSFYKELYAFSPTKVTLPPLGTQSLDMPLSPAPGSGLTGEAPLGNRTPSIPFLPPPPPSPVTKQDAPVAQESATGKTSKPAAPAQKAPVLPDQPFDTGTQKPRAQPAATPASQAATPKPAPSTPAEKPKS